MSEREKHRKCAGTVESGKDAGAARKKEIFNQINNGALFFKNKEKKNKKK